MASLDPFESKESVSSEAATVATTISAAKNTPTRCKGDRLQLKRVHVVVASLASTVAASSATEAAESCRECINV